MDIIKTIDLEFDYTYTDENDKEKRKNVLKKVNLTVPKGQFLAVLGHNGSGKSTLAKHFNAILLPSGGKVYALDIDTADEARIYDIRQNIGMVFQNPDNQIVSTIVEDDVAFALENLGIPPEEIRRRVDNALKTVEMYEYRNHAPHQLSGGQKQRVAVAGIIAMSPECIVLDEPTAMLDPRGRKEVINTIMSLNKEKKITVILITHYMEEAACADRIAVMNEGEIVLDDTPENVFSNVDYLKKIGLDVPQATEFIHELKKCGININEKIITEEQAVNEICKYLNKNNI